MLAALSGFQFPFLFAITAAGVVPCGGAKKYPRTSSVMQILFSFWSFEVSGGILRYIIGLEPFSKRSFF